MKFIHINNERDILQLKDSIYSNKDIFYVNIYGRVWSM